MSLLSRDFFAPFRRRTAPAARSPLAEAEPASIRSPRVGRGPRNRLEQRLARRRRATMVGAAEGLERRLALAINVTPITGNGFFFVDTGQGRVLNSEYSGYSITNNDPVTYADVWVQAHNFTGGVLNLSPNEDGVYHLGQLDPAETDKAWFYLTATGSTAAPQSHVISVYNGDPREGGVLIPGATANITFTRVEQTIEASANKVFTVSYDTPSPVLGGTLAMTVTGDLGQAGGDSVLFTPDTFSTWQPGVFELETATIQITSGPNARTVTDELFLTGFSSASSNPYTAVYTFRVVDVIATQTPVSPTQFVGRNLQWKHDQPIGGAFPPVPAVTNPLLLQKLAAPAGSLDPPLPAITVPDTGETVEFSLTFTNSSTRPVSLDSIRDTLPPGTVYIPGSATYAGLPIGNPTISGSKLTWLGPFPVPASGSATLTFEAVMPAVAGVYVNSSVGRVGSVQIDTTLNTKDDVPATATVTCAKFADLAITKTDGQVEDIPGTSLVYTITVTNAGPSGVTGVPVVDTFPATLDGVNWTVTYAGGASGPMMGAGDINVLLAMPKNSSATFTVTADIDEEATGTLLNTATVGVPSGVFDPNPANNTSTDTTLLKPTGDLSITKTDGQMTDVPGTSLTYTIVVANTGPSAVTGALVSDAFPADLTDISWSVTYSGGSGPIGGTGPLLNQAVNLAAAGTATFTVTATILGTARGTLSNTATVAVPPGFTDPNLDNNTATDTTILQPEADLAVVKTRTSGQPVAGLPVTYSIVVTNFGPSSVTSFTGTDTTTPALAGLDFMVNTGTYDPVLNVWTADPGDSLATGETVVFTLSGIVPSGATGLLVNKAEVLPPDGVTDPDLSNNTSTVTDEIGGVIDLSATKTGDETYKGGGLLNFTVVVTNLGPSFASGVRVTDALPAGVVNWSWTVTYSDGSGTADGSPDSVADSTAAIDKLMNLTVLGTATFTITALTDAAFQSDITNTVVATLGQESATASWSSAYDGPINPTADVGALVVTNDDLCFGLPLVRVLDAETGADRITPFLAYEARFRGSVRVATGDLTGDGVDEIVVAPGPGRPGQIRVFTAEGVELPAYRTFAFGPAYRGGVSVAVGNIDGIGGNEIIAARSSGLSRVNVFGVDPNALDPVTDVPIRSFIGIPGAYRNGAVVTAGDYGTFTNGMMLPTVADGIDEIAVGSNAGIRAQVRVYDAAAVPRQVGSFFAIRPGFRGGVTLSTARWNTDTTDDIIVGAGVGGRSIVEVYGGTPASQFARLAVFSSFGRPNAVVNAAALDITGDGVVDNLYGVQGRGGSGGTRGVTRFSRLTNLTDALPSSTSLRPPLRIAPITLRVTGG